MKALFLGIINLGLCSLCNYLGREGCFIMLLRIYAASHFVAKVYMFAILGYVCVRKKAVHDITYCAFDRSLMVTRRR
jgi:hypothetical protein